MDDKDLERRMQALYRAITNATATHGWHAIAVSAMPVSPFLPGGVYSQGLTLLGHPDMLALGFPADRGYRFLQMLYEQIRAGQRFAPGQDYHDLADGYPMRFVQVSPAWVERYCPITSTLCRIWHAQGKIADPICHVLQIVPPDKDGLWPWQPGSRLATWPLLDRLPVPDSDDAKCALTA